MFGHRFSPRDPTLVTQHKKQSLTSKYPLPDDVTRRIFEYLDADDCRQTSAVCKNWRQQMVEVARKDTFWRTLFKGMFAYRVHDSSKLKYVLDEYPTEYMKAFVLRGWLDHPGIFKQACRITRLFGYAYNERNFTFGLDTTPLRSLNIMSAYKAAHRLLDRHSTFSINEIEEFEFVGIRPRDLDSEVRVARNSLHCTLDEFAFCVQELRHAAAVLLDYTTVLQIDEEEEENLRYIVKTAKDFRAKYKRADVHH